MNIEPSIFAADSGCRLSQADHQPLLPALTPNLYHGWGKALSLALALHLVALAGLFALVGADSAPSPWLESVVVVQLAPLAQAAAASITETPAPTPAAVEPAPVSAKKATPESRPAPLPTKAKPPTKESITSTSQKPPSTPSAPVTSVPVPVAAATLTSDTSAIGHSTAGSPQPAVSQTNQKTTASAAMTVTIQPKPISQPRPAYPPVARRRGLDGKVVLDVTVSADGTVRKVAVSHSSSSSLLDEAAIASVWTWRFQPGQVGGKAKEMTIPLSIEFRLR